MKYFKIFMCMLALSSLVACGGDDEDEFYLTQNTDGTISDGVLSYQIINDNEVVVNQSLKVTSNVVIPETVKTKTSELFKTEINEYTVVGISHNAFSDDKMIKTLEYGNRIKEIGDEAFYGSSLQSITIKGSVSSLGEDVFSNCQQLKEVIFEEGSLTEIPKGTFMNCSIETIDLPNSIQKIGDKAFSGSSLKSIIIKGSVSSLGYNVFKYCQQLKEVVIEEGSLTEIPELFFFESSIETIDLPNSIQKIGDKAFSGSSLQSITIKGSVSSLGEDVFSNCQQLKQVIFEEGSLTEIPKGTFWNCSLDTIALPNSIKTIGDGAFKETKMPMIDIPDGVETIEQGAFSWCSIPIVVLGKGVKKIGRNAFGVAKISKILILGDTVFDFYTDSFITDSSYAKTHFYVKDSMLEVWKEKLKIFNCVVLPISSLSED